MQPHFLTHCLPEDYAAALRTDARTGLTLPDKTLTPRWCFDQRGRHLFERATAGGAYRLGMAEGQLLHDLAETIIALTQPHTIVHIGSMGLMRATPLWGHMPGPATLTVCDTPHAPLPQLITPLSTRHPRLEWYGVVCELPNRIAISPRAGRAVVTCLGETYSSLDTPQRRRFLRTLRRHCLPGDRILLTTTTEADTILRGLSTENNQDLTEFNRNVLHMMNHLLDTDGVDAAFDHVLTTSNDRASLGLRARRTVRLPLRMLGFHIDINAGEHITTFGLSNTPQQTVHTELDNSGFTLESSWHAEHANVTLHLATVR